MELAPGLTVDLSLLAGIFTGAAMKHISKLNLLVETVAWGAGVVLLAAYVAAQLHFARSRDAGLQAFSVARQGDESRIGRTAEAIELPEESRQAVPAVALRVAAPDMTSWSAARIAAYSDAAAAIIPSAVLRIRSINLEVPVFVGISEQNLNRGAAWIEGTAPLGSRGNAGLASHRDGYFRALRDLQVGDHIELQTFTETLLYVVDELRVVPPHAVEVLGPTNDQRLTLITCYPFYVVGPAPKRFVVRARAARAG